MSTHNEQSASESAANRHQPKLCGGDLELGNFISGLHRTHGTGCEASRALLREFDGVSGSASGGMVKWTTQDWGRKFLQNGGCAYIDLNHLEICLPEVTSAFDHVAYTHALYRLAQQAADKVNARLAEGQHLHVLANNSDGKDHSYGSHLNVLLHRNAWEDIFCRRLVHQGFLAAFQVSSLVFTGQGKVGAENGAPAINFQLSQRADFMEMICAHQTTYRRPIINSRDESLCGESRVAVSDPVTAEMARLHVIFYDQNLCQVAGLLKVGVLQIILAMMEARCVDPGLLLDDPVAAAIGWSHDPSLRRRLSLASGVDVTAVELQLRFCEQARDFVESGRCEGIVPDADFILELWSDTLEKLHRGNLAALAGRLDWVLKLSMLQQAMQSRGVHDWASPMVRHLDQVYSSLDPQQGPFWAFEKSGRVERLIHEERLLRCLTHPPEDTRAWTRTKLIGLGNDSVRVDGVDWDWVRFSLRGAHRFAPVERYTVHLANPLGWNRKEAQTGFDRVHDVRATLQSLGAVKTPSGYAGQSYAYGSGVHFASGSYPGGYSEQ